MLKTYLVVKFLCYCGQDVWKMLKVTCMHYFIFYIFFPVHSRTESRNLNTHYINIIYSECTKKIVSSKKFDILIII